MVYANWVPGSLRFSDIGWQTCARPYLFRICWLADPACWIPLIRNAWLLTCATTTISYSVLTIPKTLLWNPGN